MAAIVAKATVAAGQPGITTADLVGTETITATVGAGVIAIIIDSAVVNNSSDIDAVIEQLADRLRELNYT